MLLFPFGVIRTIADGKDAWELAQLPGTVGRELQFLGSDLGLGATGAHLDSFIAGRLRKLQQTTGATAVVLFHMEPATNQVSIRSHIGAPLKDYDTAKYSLHLTPISDVIRDRKPLSEADASRNPGRFRHLRLLDFLSCIGIPVESLGPPEYGLFLFHPRKDFFSSDHLNQASSVAAVLGAALARQETERIIHRVQPFIFIGQLGSVLVHEINNALSSVVNNASTLKLDYEKLEHDPSIAVEPWIRDEIGKCTAGISADGHRMADLVRLYLGLERREELGPTSVNQVVRQAMQVLEPKAAEDNVRMLLDLASDIPMTMTVASRLEQVFINVMLNAIQQTHLARGKGELLISTSFEPDNERLPIKVRFTDNGPGIHGQHLERIFGLGFSTRPEGTGLGLFVSEGLVKSLGGRISVEESVMMVGTTFLVELPVVVPSIEG